MRGRIALVLVAAFILVAIIATAACADSVYGMPRQELEKGLVDHGFTKAQAKCIIGDLKINRAFREDVNLLIATNEDTDAKRRAVGDRTVVFAYCSNEIIDAVLQAASSFHSRFGVIPHEVEA